MKQIRETVIRKVAKLISENDVLKNYQIERVDHKHQMSGTRNMRELRAQFLADTKFCFAYGFDKKRNVFIFCKEFQKYCKKVSKTANWSRK
jgi:hypothetical protein